MKDAVHRTPTLKKALEWEVIDRTPGMIRLLLVPVLTAHVHNFDEYERLVPGVGVIHDISRQPSASLNRRVAGQCVVGFWRPLLRDEAHLARNR